MIKVFRKGNFNTSHERQDLRRICNALKDNLDNNDDVFLLVNIDLPPVTYEWSTGGEIKRNHIDKSSPDLIVLKKDSLAVVEMKGYPGLIDYPLSGKDVWHGEWSSKFKEFPKQIINEGRGNPYSQINTNRQAFIAYLRQFEKEFSSKELQGSNWDKAKCFILFQNSTVEFAHSVEKTHEKGNWWHNMHLGSIHEAKNGEFFPHFIKDLTTGERVYKKDDRTEIALSGDCIEKLSKLLECEEVTDEYIGDFNTEETTSEAITTGAGFAPTLITDFTLKDTDKKEAFKPSEDVLSYSKELRLLSYYQRCLVEESKHSSSIFISAKNADEKRFIINGSRETIFSSSEGMEVPASEIHKLSPNLRKDNPGLTYGFSLFIMDKSIGTNTFKIAEPLFLTTVKYEDQAFEPVYQDEIIINKNVLKRLQPYSNFHESQLNDRVDEIMQSNNNPKDVIGHVFTDLGLLDSKDMDDLMVIQNMDINNLQNGFLPTTAMVYLSQSGVYNSLTAELNQIKIIWKRKIDNEEVIDDLAYRLFKGLEFDGEVDWKVPLYNVGFSNYEQSMAIGQSMNENSHLTVVSGPPGTGKTQLGINLTAEANRNNLNVLFSSKNHKAVDVLTDRYNSLFANKESIKRVMGKTQNNTGSNSKSRFGAQALKSQDRIKYNSEILVNNQDLSAIKKKVENFEEAISRIEDVEGELQTILQENTELNIINWFQDDLKILDLEYWEKKLSNIKDVEVRSKSIFGRVMDVISEEHLKFDDIFDESSFLEKSTEKILSELKKSLNEDVLINIGEDNLLQFSKKFLPILVELRKKSDVWQKYNRFIAETDLDEHLDLWNKKASENIERCIKMIDNDFINTPGSSPFMNESVTTLSAHHLKAGLKPSYYDLAIMDESSQTDIISAIPILFRSKRAVVIGDEKQLNPIVTLPKENDFNLFLSYGFSEDDYYKYGYGYSSLLSVADKELKKAKRRRVMLKEHFRCHPDIIGFSNYLFYDLDLRVKTKDTGQKAVQWISHRGDCSPKWYNSKEIELTMKLIERLKNQFSYQPHQIGVVTPFREHANHLMNMVRNRYDDSFATKLIIDTAHGFQGDEKDVMIFSLVVGESMPKSTFKWMTVQSANLINVSVTRARKRLYILGNRENIDSRTGILSDLGHWVDHCDEKYSNNSNSQNVNSTSS